MPESSAIAAAVSRRRGLIERNTFVSRSLGPRSVFCFEEFTLVELTLPRLLMALRLAISASESPRVSSSSKFVLCAASDSSPSSRFLGRLSSRLP